MSNQTAALTEEAEPPKREHQLPPLLDSISWSHIRSHFCHLLPLDFISALLVKSLYIGFMLEDNSFYMKLVCWHGFTSLYSSVCPLHFSVFFSFSLYFLCISLSNSRKNGKKQKATSSVGLPLGGLLSVLPLYFFQYFSVNQPHLSA